MKMLLVFFISLALMSCTGGENPAIQLALTDKGLQTVRHFAAGVVQGKLDEVTFPEVHGTIWGLLHYSLSGMQIAKCDLPEPSVHFSPDVSGLALSVSGLSVALTGDWATYWTFGRDSGTFDMAVFDVSVSSALRVDRDVSGHLSLSSVSCDADLQAVELQFHGGVSWMLSWLMKYLSKNMKEKVQNSICPGVEDAVTRLEQHLQAMNVSVDVNSVVSLELPLSAAPAVDSNWINFGLRGEFLSVETQHEPPFVAPPFSLATPSDVMVSVGVSEYSANSASFAYYDSGHLQTLINDSSLPPYCPVRLNTSSWGPYIPQDSAFSVKMWIDSGKVKSLMKMDNFTLSLDSSEIGPFKTEALENVAETGAKAAVQNINVKLQQGFDLPQIKHAELLNSILTVEEGFIAFFSDAKLQST